MISFHPLIIGLALDGLHRLNRNCQLCSIPAGIGWNIPELALGGVKWPPKNFQSQFRFVPVIILVVPAPLPVTIPDQPRFMAIMGVGEREHATRAKDNCCSLLD